MLIYVLLMSMPLAALLLAAAWIDLRVRRIPNYLTVILVVVGIGRSFIDPSLLSTHQALTGALLGFTMALALFLVGAFGGGDVKLMAGIGAWLGPAGVTLTFAIAALLGMIMVVVYGLRNGKIRELLHNTALLAGDMLGRKRLDAKAACASAGEFRSVGKPLPFAVPAALATASVVLVLPLLRSVLP